MLSRINLKVLIIDSDFYAAQAINGYLAWDRRTRVVEMTDNIMDALDFIKKPEHKPELPDVILLEAELLPDAAALRDTITELRRAIPDVAVVCLAHRPDPERASAALDAGAKAFLLRNELKLQIVGAICYAMEHDFVVTSSIQSAASAPFDARIFRADLVPPQREYPEMTERIRQALWLCVVEGLPASLAADEMGISPHTIRSYIKEGYRILEAHDNTDYPDNMGPLEKAFMRFTALDDEDDEKKPPASELQAGEE